MAIPVDQDPDFERLLATLRDTRGFDFTGYKRSSLGRRTRKRMAAVGVDSYDEYLELLGADGDEVEALFNPILINVTSFFRDAPTWRALQEVVLPALVDGSIGPPPSEANPLRVWSAGCASGQEAFSVAMLLAELLEPERLSSCVKIFATDI